MDGQKTVGEPSALPSVAACVEVFSRLPLSAPSSDDPHLLVSANESMFQSRIQKKYTHPFFKITFRMDCFIFTVFPKMLVFF